MEPYRRTYKIVAYLEIILRNRRESIVSFEFYPQDRVVQLSVFFRTGKNTIRLFNERVIYDWEANVFD